MVEEGGYGGDSGGIRAREVSGITDEATVECLDKEEEILQR